MLNERDELGDNNSGNLAHDRAIGNPSPNKLPWEEEARRKVRQHFRKHCEELQDSAISNGVILPTLDERTSQDKNPQRILKSPPKPMEAQSSDTNKSFTASKTKTLQVWFSKSMEAPTLLIVLHPEDKTLQVWFKDSKHTPDQNQKGWGSNPRQIFLCSSCRRAIFLEARRDPQSHNKTTKKRKQIFCGC